MLHISESRPVKIVALKMQKSISSDIFIVGSSITEMMPVSAITDTINSSTTITGTRWQIVIG